MTGGCGCGCGAVRYVLASAPTDAAWCHCRTCQLNSGSPAMALATVPTADLTFERGREELRSFGSSDEAERSFCGRCGTPLYVADHREPEVVYISLATLDDPAATPPGFHIFYASRIAWAPAGDGLPTYETFRRPPGSA